DLLALRDALRPSRRLAEVRVRVDRREARLRHAGLLGMERAPRLEILEGERPSRRLDLLGLASRRGHRATRRGGAQHPRPDRLEPFPTACVAVHAPYLTMIAWTFRLSATASSNFRSHMFRPNITPVAPLSMYASIFWRTRRSSSSLTPPEKS